MEFDPGICDISQPVIFFPVRHHSPVCARLVRSMIADLSPALILIEGPSDFNPQIQDLFLPHDLPISIYSYIRLADGTRQGAFYPFCEHSPEWQGIQMAHELGIPVRFIDLPWSQIALAQSTRHRYGDPELKMSSYTALLCQRLGVEGFDALWDLLFEIETQLPLEMFLDRFHRFCFQCRLLQGPRSEGDRRREAFMAHQIRQAQAEVTGQIVVITGGFHSYALFAQVYQRPFLEAQEGDLAVAAGTVTEQGIALTPFTDERLDSLTGYEAGMPSPGFYRWVWRQGETTGVDLYRRILEEVAEQLRQRGQGISTADLIAVETTARALAALRGHERVWRQDLIDAILSSLVKEEIRLHVPHPFLGALYDLLRGEAQGRLAQGTSMPPLVEDIKRRLQICRLQLQPQRWVLRLELGKPLGLSRSQLFHQLQLLSISGFEWVAGTDLSRPGEWIQLWEEWEIHWSPQFEASCIEKAAYGLTLEAAALARLMELALQPQRSTEHSALLLLQAGQMGVMDALPPLCERLVQRIRSDGDLISICGALAHLLYLYRYDEVLGMQASTPIGQVLSEAYGRGLWQLESLGQISSQEEQVIGGIKILLETQRCCGDPLSLSQAELISVLNRVAVDGDQVAMVKGAVVGALWRLGEAPVEQILSELGCSTDPEPLGDFLKGLFHLAREVVQRHTELLHSIDTLIMGFSEDLFLESLPALRLAFTDFSPREKHRIAQTLTESWQQSTPLPEEEIAPEVIAYVQELERAAEAFLIRYGLQKEGI